MRHHLLLLFSLISITSAYAQSVIVIETEKGESIPFACVKVTQANQTQVYFSDGEGKVIVEANNGTNIDIQVDAFGYESHVANLQVPVRTTITLIESSQQLGEVVITGQLTEKRAEEAVHQVRVIGRRRIEQLGSNNVTEVLSREMNIRVSQDNVLGSGIEMQGVSGQNIKVLIDGVPMVGRLDGNIDLSQIDVNSIERIEVIQGPLSVQYGTDALGGTINIITRKSADKNAQSARVSAFYESVGQYNTHVDYNLHRGKHAFQINAGRQYFDGWSANDDAFRYMREIESDSSRFQNWKPKLQYTVRTNYDYSVSERLKLGTSIAGFYEEMKNRGLPRGFYQETAFDDIYRTHRYDIALRLNYQIDETSNFNILSGNNYYRRTKNTYLRDLTDLSATLTPSLNDQDTTVFNTAMSRGLYVNSAISNFTYSVGYDFSHEYTEGARIQNSHQQMTDIAAFASAEWLVDSNIIIRPGVRFGTNSRFAIPIIPSLQLKWGAEEDVLRLSYARGFRSPSLKELYFNFVDINHNIVGNLDLTPEDGHNLRAAYKHFYKSASTVMSLEFSGSYNYINNMISLAQAGTGTVYTYLNIGQFESVAGNMNASWTHHRIKIDLGLAYIGRRNALTEGLPSEYLFSPEAQATMQYTVPQWQLSLSAFYKYNGVRLGWAVDENEKVYQTQIEDYSLLDLTVNKSFLRKKLQVSIGAKNILDVTNLNSTIAGGAHGGGGSVPQSWGRSYFAKITYNILP